MYHQKYYIYFTNKTKLIDPKNKYLIVAVLKNISPIMNDYLTEMKKLIEYLGEDNVYISIMENGDSNDTTRIGLNDFRQYLNSKNISNRIITDHILDLSLYEDRVEKLVELRNYAIGYLYEIEDKINYKETRIIFMNDVIFNYQDVITLLATNHGDYDAVCGMDYYESFYDVWVSIGIDGFQTRRYFPFFINKIQQDAYMNGEYFRVFSCWNGMFISKADPFEKKHIKFRFGYNRRESECTLLCADFYSNGYGKILLNTNIILAYTYEYYYKNKYVYFWGKHLITYFYYYFQYTPWKRRFRRNYNMIDFKPQMSVMSEYLEYNYIYFYQNVFWI